MNLHAGYQRIKDASGGNSQLSYTGWKVGVAKNYDILTNSAAPIGTTSDTYRGPDGENLGKNSLIVTVDKTF
ncbi:MAG TPA: TorF family putative porin [Noviherbaspirillum sp.]|nr:TorF family putative porin [Noviherbaspirillum sp.]